MTDLYNLLKGEPKLFFIGHYCSKVTVQSCEELAPLKPTWIAVSTRVAQVVMPDYDPLIIHGCAEVPTSLQVNIRDEFGVSKDSRVIGFIGSVDDIDPSLLVEVSRRLKARLLIAGTGGNITKLSETETGPVKVVPTIPMNREDWYKAFDVFVYPVLNPGFTSLPLEALLCGCPVAMTPVSDMFNFCKDWMSFFHPGEIPTQITQAVIAAAGSNVSASREFVLKEFSPEKMASGWALSLLGDSS
jgi:glycosyltransferase involved in cell wall biosynthesis